MVVTVYEFEVLDTARHVWVKDHRVGTLVAIRGTGGIPIAHSALVVDESRVGADGFVVTGRTLQAVKDASH